MFMSSNPDMNARHGALLAELAEIGMAMARGLREEMETAEAPEAKARAMTSFTKIARTVRQCVALEARLDGDATRAAVEAQAHEDRDLQRRIRRRKARVTHWVQRAICNDAREDDDEDLIAERMEDLRERLDENLLDADFADRPLGEVLAMLCADLGLDPDRVLGEHDDDDPEDPDEEPEGGPDEDDPAPDDPLPEDPPPEDPGGPRPQPPAPEGRTPEAPAPRRDPPPWAHASYRHRFG